MTSASQRAGILAHLRTGSSITDADARRLFGCTRIAARIHELKQPQYGEYDIIDERSKLKVRYSVYRLRTIAKQGLLMALPARGRPE